MIDEGAILRTRETISGIRSRLFIVKECIETTNNEMIRMENKLKEELKELKEKRERRNK